MDDQDVFSALSNPTRRAILNWMRNSADNFGPIGSAHAGEVCVSAVQRKTGLSQSTGSAIGVAPGIDRSQRVLKRRIPLPT